MLSLIFLGLCLAGGLSGACILVLTRLEMRESDCLRLLSAEWGQRILKMHFN